MSADGAGTSQRNTIFTMRRYRSLAQGMCTFQDRFMYNTKGSNL